MPIDLTRPIPELRSVEGWKHVPIAECGEVLIPLGPNTAHRRIVTDSIYVGERASSPYRRGQLDGALLTVFARAEVSHRLSRAASFLPPEHVLIVWDAYRPLSVQGALFDYYADQLVSAGMKTEDVLEAAQKFVRCLRSTRQLPLRTIRAGQ